MTKFLLAALSFSVAASAALANPLEISVQPQNVSVISVNGMSCMDRLTNHAPSIQASRVTFSNLNLKWKRHTPLVVSSIQFQVAGPSPVAVTLSSDEIAALLGRKDGVVEGNSEINSGTGKTTPYVACGLTFGGLAPLVKNGISNLPSYEAPCRVIVGGTTSGAGGKHESYVRSVTKCTVQYVNPDASGI